MRLKTTTWMLALLASPLACEAADPSAPPDDEELVDRIIGGQTAPYKEYRWMASLRTGEDQHWCGGSLIAERWVATAAHCVCDGKVESVVVGGFDVSNANDGDRRGIVDTIVHPGYDCGAGAMPDDIALLKLDATTSAIPIAINDDPQFPDPVGLANADATADNSVAIGWGLDQNGMYPDKLKDVQVPVVTNNDCNAAYGTIVPGQICAGHTGGGEDACFGDSGGPLIGYDYSQPFLVGATSFGLGCAQPGFPGVYTRVSAYVEWFRSHGVPFTTRSDLERPSDPARLVGLGGVTNAVKRQHLFARTSGAHLKYYRGELSDTWTTASPGPNWDIGDVAALEGPERGDFGVPHYSAYARRDDGALVMYERTAAGPFVADNLTDLAGGHDIDGDPFVTRGPRTSSGEETRHVFATGQGDQGLDGSIIHYYGSPATAWGSEDLSSVTGAGPDERAVGRLALLNSAGMADAGGRSMQVYFRGPANNLAHYYWSKQNGWATEDLSQRLEDEGDLGGAEIRIAGDPVVLNGDSAHNYGVRSQHAFAINVDGHLAHYYWNNIDSWAAENLTDMTGAGSDGEIDGTPTVINGPIRGNGGVRSMHVFGRNQSNDLVHYWWINYAGWQFENLTAKFGNGETIDGDPQGFIGTVVGNSGVQDIHLYARRGTDLIHYWWLNHSSWQAENLSTMVTAPGGTPPLVLDPLVALQGPQKGNGGIEAHHVYTKPTSFDPYDFKWLNHSSWSWRFLLGFP